MLYNSCVGLERKLLTGFAGPSVLMDMILNFVMTTFDPLFGINNADSTGKPLQHQLFHDFSQHLLKVMHCDRTGEAVTNLPTPGPSLPAGRGAFMLRQNTVYLDVGHGSASPLPFQGRGRGWVDSTLKPEPQKKGTPFPESLSW